MTNQACTGTAPGESAQGANAYLQLYQTQSIDYQGARQKRHLHSVGAPQLCCSMGDLNAGLVSGVHTTGPGGPSSSAPTVT
jgi:hypothetical protein